MNPYDLPPLSTLLTLVSDAVTLIGSWLEPALGASSAACAVVVLTLAVRVLLIPVGWAQARAGATRQRLAPEIAALQRRHRTQPELLQRKLRELYARENASPFAGCLPVLAQAPLLMAVYGVFVHAEIGGSPNPLLGESLFGVPLGQSLVGLVSAGTVTWEALVVIPVIMLIIAGVALASRRVLPPPQVQTPRGAGTPDLSGMTRVLGFLPLLTAAMAGIVPLAAALYLMTTTAWTLGERWLLTRIIGRNLAE